MNRIDGDTAAAREMLSIYMDGELPVEQRDGLLRHVKTGVSVRADWAVYHCIGDVLRSDDTAYVSPAFAQQLRERLDAEPFLFAPEVAKAYSAHQMRPASRWRRPAAVAASVAAVLAVGSLMFPLHGFDSSLPQTAQAPQAPQAPQVPQAPQAPLIQSIQSPKNGPDSRETAASERSVPTFLPSLPLSIPPAPLAASAVGLTAAPDGGIRAVSNEYLMAHRNYSTGLAMRGVVSHVRTAGYDGK